MIAECRATHKDRLGAALAAADELPFRVGHPASVAIGDAVLLFSEGPAVGFHKYLKRCNGGADIGVQRYKQGSMADREAETAKKR